MKRIFKISFIALVISCIFSMTNVYAASPYKWTVDGQNISMGMSNDAGNVTWKSDENYSGGVLTLNNYEGGQLKIGCYGTGSQGMVFAIKLVGNNKITVDKGVGIISDYPIIFIGDGKLTIEASVPMGGSVISDTGAEQYKGRNQITMVIDQKTSNNVVCDNTPANDNSVIKDNNDQSSLDVNDNDKADEKLENTIVDNEEKEESVLNNTSLINIILLSFCAISFIVIIVLVIKLISTKKAIKEF